MGIKEEGEVLCYYVMNRSMLQSMVQSVEGAAHTFFKTVS
jgi:hypothetical protein